MRKGVMRKGVMRKPITPRIHGMLDYTTSAAVTAAPYVFGFPKPARRMFHALSASYTGLSAMTDYPLAAKRVVPFKAHGAVELGLAALLPVAPWAFGFAKHRAARNLCFGLSALTVAVAALTDWDDDDE